MRQCKFDTAPTGLSKKNDNLGIKKKNNSYSFKLNGIKFTGLMDKEDTKCRITLLHKVTGETLTFYDTETVTFVTDLDRLAPQESGSNLGATYAELTRQYGSTKAQKQLREKEKLSINKEAQKTLKDAHRDALKEEKSDAAKGNKLGKGSADSPLDGSFAISSLSDLIDTDRRIKLSTIAPKDVLDALQAEAETVIGLTYEQIENLKSNLAFQGCILDFLKPQASYNMRKMKLCILLEYMIRFLTLPINKVRSKEPLMGCHPTVMRFIIQNFTKEVFTEGGKSTLHVNKDEKDKLYMVIIALYTYLHDYKSPISRFMVDIKAGRDRIKKLGQLIDLKIITENKEALMMAAKPYIIDDIESN